MSKFQNPRDIRKRFKRVQKDTRANTRRYRHNNTTTNQIANCNEPQQQRSNLIRFGNGKHRKKREKKQHRGVWRKRKGGKNLYIGLDGQQFEGRAASKQCILDKQILDKLAETKRMIQSPSWQQQQQQYRMVGDHRNMNNHGIGSYDDPQHESTLIDWGIPPEIVQNYALNGIRSLYQWQTECLSAATVSATKNLLYCAPTSGGKTLVSEILMIRSILFRRKKCLFILPFISLVLEKVSDLRSKVSCLGILVEAYHSNLSLSSIVDADILCCTIEKGNSILNKMMEERDLIDKLGAVVIDEFHYIGDAHRGWILEIFMTKIRFLLKDNVQIIGMSATLPNLDHIAQWLDGTLYVTKNRPVELTQFYKHKDAVYNSKGSVVRRIQQHYPNDTEHVVTLCQEVTIEGASVLVFCEKKAWCKTCCNMIAECLSMSPLQADPSLLNRRRMILCELQELPNVLCPVLKTSILYGVAYHHAGLTLEEREIIEGGFRKNVINILVATSTLAAGVNLPARRVLFRTPRVGRNWLSPSKYKQMAGRAGRKGIDEYGESIVICKDQTEANFVRDKLIQCPLEPISSQLFLENNLQRFLLEGFGTNSISTSSDLNRYLNLSLQCTECEVTEWQSQCQQAVDWLIQNEFLKHCKVESNGNSMDSSDPKEVEMKQKESENSNRCGDTITVIEDKKEDENDESEHCYFEGILEITPLGLSTIGSGLDPKQSLLIFDEIAKTRKHGLHLTNSLHLCYLLSPVRNNGGNIEPNWERYYDIFMKLNPTKKEIAASVGISEQILCEYALNPSHRPPYRSTNALHVKYKRFYSAIILNQIIEEQPISNIVATFNIEGGQMQSLQSSSASFASSISVFCIKLNWNCMAQIIAHFAQRLSFGVSSELLPLMKISDIKAFRARTLYDYGLVTIEQIAKADVETIVLALSSRSSFSTNDLQKRLLINHAQKIKYEANAIHNRMITLQEQEED